MATSRRRAARFFPPGDPARAEPQSGGARAAGALVGILIFDEEAHCISTHRFDLVADGPQERRHLARDRPNDDGFARSHQAPVAGAKPRLHPPGDLAHRLRQTLECLTRMGSVTLAG